MRKTELAFLEAIAIRWDCIPSTQKIKKAYIFNQLRDLKDLCLPSGTREMLQQEDGRMKGVRCIVVCMTAFSPIMQEKLRTGNAFM